MNNQLDQDLEHIFADIYDHNDTTEPHDESLPPRTLNVYIDVEEEEATNLPPTVNSTVDEYPTSTVTDEAETPRHTEHPTRNDATALQPRKRQRRLHLAVLLFLMLSLVGALVGYAVLIPLWTPSANITIVTASQHLTTTSTVQLVTNGTADPMKQQLAGRALSTITMSQQKTIPTTGTTRQDAQAAHGLITFYNAAPYIQTIEVGTLLIGTDGIQVLTDQAVIISAALMPTEGQVTVSAHATLPGPQGNIRAGDIYGACCRLNVFVASGAFHGGQDARTYQSVAPQDINSTASLKSSLDQSVQAVF